ncbi:MAG: hypothetical protein LBP22_12560 [Deltaproteobacteria bacterium]|nr:hypothetical protein [Deltaproteobacteria bacterium]
MGLSFGVPAQTDGVLELGYKKTAGKTQGLSQAMRGWASALGGEAVRPASVGALR